MVLALLDKTIEEDEIIPHKKVKGRGFKRAYTLWQ